MYCRNCGEFIDDQAVVCVHCGVPTDNLKKYSGNAVEKEPQQTTFVLVSILSFFIPIAGFIIAAVQLTKNPKLAKTALISAIIGVILSLLILLADPSLIN